MNKIYVSSELKAILTCPKCGKSKKADVSKFMPYEKEVKLKCTCSTCKNKFTVLLERRRSIRKNVHYSGWMNLKNKKYKILVKDMSKHGLKIAFHDKISVETGTKINIEFTLDDPMESPVKIDVRIKKTFSSSEIGCEYINFNHEGNLVKYFMFHF